MFFLQKRRGLIYCFGRFCLIVEKYDPAINSIDTQMGHNNQNIFNDYIYIINT